EVYDNALEGIEGLITVEGGKYTTSRNLAYHVLELVQKKLDLKLKDSITYNNYLSGCEIKDMEQFMIKLHKKYRMNFSENTIEYIGRNYGTESSSVFKIANGNKKMSEVLNAEGEILAEVVYAIEEEMAKTLKDIFLRRTGLGTLGDPGNHLINKVADLAAKLLSWNEQQKKDEIENLKKIFILPGN
ncbi:MAG: glycerol-3-phosphate dehydrogenase C-terminal domain-containing protein, partial [Bacteroidales bacterium]|nr:glycerol-3-phosphate dehydrogenase C-terminal domain-containing protein [Bacteroidales bacterium]